MADQFTAEWKKLSADVTRIGSRIRRYRLDPLLRRSDLAQPVFKREPAAVLVSRADGEAAIPSEAAAGAAKVKTEVIEKLKGGRMGSEVLERLASAQPRDDFRRLTDSLWDRWVVLWENVQAVRDSFSAKDDIRLRKELMTLEGEVDGIQRELVSENSRRAGIQTVVWMSITLVATLCFYFLTHGVRSFDLTTFEPWPEWGPMKYGEVAFWSFFGVLCSLLYIATYYLSRRDFDIWYKPWYLSTALRAPFHSVILMVVLLEFLEWYGEDKWVQTYLLEEGNKFFFIVILSFCLGLTSDRTARIVGHLAHGIGDFFEGRIRAFGAKLSSTVPAISTKPK